MRPVRLSLEAFGPYAEAEEIDFEALRAAGLFVVAGPTGSGKSSIFDALSYALYGQLAGARQGAKSIRSDHAPAERACEVSLDFVANNQSWRVTRRPSFEREKKRGGGITTAAPKATLARFHEGSWQGIESKQREVDEKCRELVGLDFEQFQRVVLLPQGGFSQVLNASSKDRQNLLRTLFSTDVFNNACSKLKDFAKREEDSLGAKQEVIEDRLSHTRSSLASALSEAALPIELPGDVSITDIEELLAQQLEPQIELMRKELDLLKAEQTSQRAHLTEAERTIKKQKRLIELRLKGKNLKEEVEVIEKSRNRIETSHSALPLLSLLKHSEQGSAALAESTKGERGARLELQTVMAGLELPNDLSGGDLLNVASQIDLERKRFVDLLGQQKSLNQTEKAQREAEQELVLEAVDLREATLQLSAHERHQEELTREVTEARKASLSLASLEEKYKIITNLAKARRRLKCLRKEIVDAESQIKELGEARAKKLDELKGQLQTSADLESHSVEKMLAAEVAYEATLSDFIKATAPRMAAELLDDKPCAVCGSRSHPEPAASAEDEILGIDDLQRAQNLRIEANEMAKKAASKKQLASDEFEMARRLQPDQDDLANELLVLRTKETALLEEIGESSSMEESKVEQDLSSSLDEFNKAKLAAETLTEDQLELEELSEKISVSSLAVAKQGARLDEHRISVEKDSAILNSKLSDLATELAGLDPQEEIDGTDAKREAVNRLDAFSKEHTTAKALASKSKSTLNKALAESPFESTKEVLFASLDEQEILALENTVSLWQTSTADTQTLIRELEEENLPERAPDIDALRAKALEATSASESKAEATTAARTHLGTVKANLTSLGSLGQEITDSQRHAEELRKIADVCDGRNNRRVSLEAWVLGAYLREVVAQANLHLLPMSSGRYSLAVAAETGDRRGNSGLNLEVQDTHTGRSRAASSLSGGETFQASLALALGLADVVTAGRSGLELDCIFIDEGFGSLDPDSLELAIDVLDGLRSRGSLVGVVTHVGALKETLELGIEVLPRANGEGSTLRQLL